MSSFLFTLTSMLVFQGLAPLQKPLSPDYSNGLVARQPILPSVVTSVQAIARSQNWVDFYYRWGNALHGQEQLENAIQAYQYALNLNPQHPPSLINQGLSLLEMGQFSRASTNFNAILKLPDEVVSPASLHTIAYYNLAIIHNRRGETALAIQAVQAALRLSPNFGKAQLLLQRLETPASVETPQ